MSPLAIGPACQVWANGSSIGDCQSLVQKYAGGIPSWIAPVMYGAIIFGVIMTSLLLYTKWHQRAYGRKLEGWTGIIGVMKIPSGGGAMGKMIRYTEKLYQFIPFDKKATKPLISAMPDSIIQLDQRDGGAAFAFIDGDKRVTVAPDVAVWCDEGLGELAESHDWPTFCYRFKKRQLESLDLTPKFPPIADGIKEVNLVYADGKTQTRQVAQLSKEDREWYDKMSVYEGSKLREIKQSQLRVDAALSGATSYVMGGQEVPFLARDKAALSRQITKEIEDFDGPLTDVIRGGRTITTRHIAGIMRGLPDAAYINGLVSDIKEKLRGENHTGWKDIMPYAIGGAIVIGAIAISAIVLLSVLK